MIRVIIADDHRIFRQGLAGLIAEEQDMELVGEAGNGTDALRLIHELQPDVAVLDLSMPRPDGIEVARQLNAEQIASACLILTMHDSTVTMHRAMDAGARGYLVKDGAYEEFVAAVRQVASGRAYFNASITAECGAAGQNPFLTRREQEVLRLTAQGLSSKTIADQLEISPRTVENHRQNIMKKLQIHNATSLVNYAVKQQLL